jgi:hypothetical protein
MHAAYNVLTTPSVIPSKPLYIHNSEMIDGDEAHIETSRIVERLFAEVLDRLAAALLSERVDLNQMSPDDFGKIQFATRIDVDGDDHTWNIVIAGQTPDLYGVKFALRQHQIPINLIDEIDAVVDLIGRRHVEEWRKVLPGPRFTLRLTADLSEISNHQRLELVARAGIPIREVLSLQPVDADTA